MSNGDDMTGSSEWKNILRPDGSNWRFKRRLRALCRLGRYPDGEAGARPRATADTDASAMIADYFFAEMQSQPGTSADFLCGEKGVENFFQIIRFYSAAGVADGYFSPPVGFLGGNLNLTLIFDGLGGIDEQVHEYLTELVSDTFNLRQLAKVFHDLGFLFQLVADHIQCGFQALV